MTRQPSSRTYLPAAGHDWLLPLYDPIVKLLGGDAARRALIDQAALQPGHRVLEIGCGTGTLLKHIKRLHPDVTVVGLDPDPKALDRARKKVVRAGISIEFDQGFADELPYVEGSFDRVFSSFMFHHLPAAAKGNTLGAIRRVLKPGGEFHMVDFEGPEDGKMGLLTCLFHSRDQLKDNSEARVLSLMQQAGFTDPKKIGRQAMIFGRVAFYCAGT
jgi:ubiquinone/menaquinone biosynthesis C-methylase UbiE